MEVRTHLHCARNAFWMVPQFRWVAPILGHYGFWKNPTHIYIYLCHFMHPIYLLEICDIAMETYPFWVMEMRHGFHRKSQVKHYQRVVSPMYPWIFVQKNPLLSHIYSYRYSMNIWRCPKSWGDPKNAGWFVSWRIHLEVDDDLGVPPF